MAVSDLIEEFVIYKNDIYFVDDADEKERWIDLIKYDTSSIPWLPDYIDGWITVRLSEHKKMKVVKLNG